MRKRLSKIRTMVLMLTLSMIMLLMACKPTIDPYTPLPEPPPPVGTDTGEKINDIKETVNLDLAVFHNSSAAITYNQQEVYNAANGEEYRSGSIKPVWQELGNRLNFTITDKAKTYKDQTALWEGVKSDQFAGFDLLTANASDINQEATVYGTFLDLGKYLDYMPNLKNMVESNDIIKKSVFVGNSMYYAPYFDGFDDLERMIILRADWVRALLDGDTAPAFDTQAVASLGFEYTPFLPAYDEVSLKIVDPADETKTKTITKTVQASENIINIQNALEIKNGATLASALRQYIDTTYPNLYGKERSKLFVSAGAAYDTDELIALLRVVKANPALLTGNAETDIVPIYPRGNTNDRTHDIMRLAQIFGLRGTESRQDFLFVDGDGELQDARQRAATYDTIEILHTLYKDGLILQDFTNADAVSVTGNTVNLGSGFRERLISQNRGFLTYDYNQTTTIYNKRLRNEIDAAGKAKFKNWDKVELLPVLPPFTKWDNSTKVSRFTESWRSVKPNGWAIKSGISDAKLYRALKLVDYLYSPEGNRLMSYGPEAWIDGTIEYMGKQVPKLSDKALLELETLAKGNYTNYYRYYLGGTFPIGYIKEQGMEFQCTDEYGKIGQANINKAILLDTFGHLVVNSADAANDKTLLLVPTALPIASAQQTILLEKCTALRENFDTSSSKDKAGNNIFSKLIINGFGTGANQLGTKETVLNNIKETGTSQLNGKTYLTIYKAAYKTLYK